MAENPFKDLLKSKLEENEEIKTKYNRITIAENPFKELRLSEPDEDDDTKN